jgi:hypothetical protein
MADDLGEVSDEAPPAAQVAPSPGATAGRGDVGIARKGARSRPRSVGEQHADAGVCVGGASETSVCGEQRCPVIDNRFRKCDVGGVAR